jgi:hypothetical protein
MKPCWSLVIILGVLILVVGGPAHQVNLIAADDLKINSNMAPNFKCFALEQLDAALTLTTQRLSSYSSYALVRNDSHQF